MKVSAGSVLYTCVESTLIRIGFNFWIEINKMILFRQAQPYCERAACVDDDEVTTRELTATV